MVGNRIYKKLTFTHSGDSETISQVVEMPEGGALGIFDIFARRVSGTGDGHIEYIYGSFEESGENGYQLGASYNNWTDELFSIRWNGDSNQFPYLKIDADFEEDEGSTTVEVYIVCF